MLYEISEILLPMFSARIFMVSQLIFKAFIHFEFILLYSVSWWSSFFFFSFTCTSVVLPTLLLMRLSLFHCMSCPLCQILIDHKDTGLYLGSLFCSIDLCVCSYASTRLFWLQLPCNIVWYQVLWFLQFYS